MAIRWVTNADGKGWLIVRYPDASTYPPLPQYLRVSDVKTEQRRDWFTIVEGRNNGKMASVSLKTDGSSYLSSVPAPLTRAAHVKFDLNTGRLWYGDSGPVWATTMETNPVPVGVHDLEIPYEAHDLGARYESRSIFAKTWFRIGHSGDRFLHPGRISAGCATVTDVSAWTSIYEYLIKSRKSDGLSVGVLEVVDGR